MRKILITIVAAMMVVMTIGMTSAVVQASGLDSLTIGGTTTGTNGQDVSVTINATNMSNIGNLQLELSYDKNVITASNPVIAGGITSGSLFSPNIDNTIGKVTLGWNSTTGMSGTGTLATITFHVVGNAGATSHLDINLVNITDPNNIPVTSVIIVINGIFSVNSIVKLDQTITFGPLSDKTIGDAPFDVSATASSGLPVSFSIVSGPATILGNTITITGTGLVTVRANQSGNDTYNPAPNVDQTFTVNAKQTNGGTAQGKVFNDLDKDKKLDKGEPGIADVVVQITGDDKKTKNIKLKTKTDKNGNYIFSNLPDGKYKVYVETKHGWSFTTSTSKEITIKNGNVVTVNFGEKLNKKKDDEKHK